MNEPTYVFHSASISSIERMELSGFVSFRVWLAKEFWWEWGIPRKLLGDPRKFFLFLLQEGTDICQRQVLGVGSPSHCLPSLWLGPILLPTGGVLSLTSCVLPSLRRQTSCYKFFNIAVIRATGSSSCLAFLCSDTTSCSIKGTSPLCLEATSFSPTGSKATGGTLAPLLFLGLRGMLCEGIVSSLSFTQYPVKSPKCESAFFFFSTVAQGSWAI